MATDTSKITTAANDLGDGLAKGGGAAKTLGAEIVNVIKSLDSRITTLESAEPIPPEPPISSAALEECIKQNTMGGSEGYPAGTPNHEYGWYAGKSSQNAAPPSNFTSASAWGVFFPEDQQPVVTGKMQIVNMESWVLLKTGAWTLLQNQDTQEVEGGYYYADFHDDIHTQWATTKQPDGSRQGPTPPQGQTVHWWPIGRGLYTAGTVSGAFVKCDIKIVGPNNMRFVAQIGGDWWLNKTAPWLADQSNNPAMGSSNWLKLTTSYRTFYYMTMNEQQIRANPPPPLK